MDIAFVIIAVIVGILLIIIEILFIPGTTVVGGFGLIVLGVGIYFSYLKFGTSTGNYVLIGSAVLTGGLIYYSFKSGTWLWLANDKSIDSKVTQKDQENLKAGDVGRTISALRPMGTANFFDNHFEVESEGGFIAENTSVRILDIKNNRIIVEEIKVL